MSQQAGRFPSLWTASLIPSRERRPANQEDHLRLNDFQTSLLAMVVMAAADAVAWIRLPTVPPERRSYMLSSAICNGALAVLSVVIVLLEWRRRRT